MKKINFDTWEEPEPLHQKMWRFFSFTLLNWLTTRVSFYKIKRIWFRIKNGWRSEDCWSLDLAFARWIIPILESKLDEYVDENSPQNQKLYDNYWKILQCFYSVKADFICGYSYFKPIQYEGLKYFIQLIMEYNKVFGKNVSDWWIKRLIEFSKNTNGWPCHISSYKHPYFSYDNLNKKGQITFDEKNMLIWKAILKKIITAFQIVYDGKDGNDNWDENNLRKMKKGFSYFLKYYRDLWY